MERRGRVAPADGPKNEKIRPTLKSLKHLATKLTPVATPIPDDEDAEPPQDNLRR